MLDEVEGQQFEEQNPEVSEGGDSFSEAMELKEGKYRFGEREFDHEQLGKAFEAYENMDKWQKSYTQRDMALAEERKSISSARKVEEFLSAHPELYGEVEGLFKKYQGGQPERVDGPKMDPVVMSMQEKLERLETDLAVKEEMGKIQSEMKELESGEYGKFFQDNPKLKGEIAQFAYENDIRNMKQAFRAFMFDKVRMNEKEKGMQEGAKAGQRVGKLTQPTGGKAVAPGGPVKGDWNDVAKAIMNNPKYDFGE